jgi:hypothetical protein
MHPTEFKKLQLKVLETIPQDGIEIWKISQYFQEIELGGYGGSDCKAAILGLKAQGLVYVNYDDNKVYKTD